MGRTLTFQQIVDSRLKGGETRKDLTRIVSAVKTNLRKLRGVKVWTGKPRKVVFGPPEPSIQWRVDFRVKKTSNDTTWNDIYRAVNRVRAVPYSFR